MTASLTHNSQTVTSLTKKSQIIFLITLRTDVEFSAKNFLICMVTKVGRKNVLFWTYNKLEEDLFFSTTNCFNIKGFCQCLYEGWEIQSSHRNNYFPGIYHFKILSKLYSFTLTSSQTFMYEFQVDISLEMIRDTIAFVVLNSRLKH